MMIITAMINAVTIYLPKKYYLKPRSHSKISL